MTIDEMRSKKAELGYTNEQISALSGVPLGTVQKIFGGATTAPRYGTLQKLSAVFSHPAGHPDQTSEQKNTGTDDLYQTPDSLRQPPAMLREEALAYGGKKQGEYTLADYYALPDERRVELIDGVIYDMSAPSAPHQAIIGELHLMFQLFVRSQGGPCKIFIPPLDVQLDQDDRTMVQPDLIVICRRDIILRRCCFGAPDMVVEILSPSTRRKDIHIKTMKYMNAGVREYWMIDPDKKQVLVYEFTKDEFPRIYGFDSRIPVGIWDGALEIDFAEISRQIAYIYENEDAAPVGPERCPPGTGILHK